MSSLYRESYSYTDEQGITRSVRFNGRNKKETDAQFQRLLCEPKTTKKAPTLKEYVDTIYRKSFIDGLAVTTRSNYERYLRLYILPFMGDMPMDSITLATIQEFYDWLASRILIIAEEMKVIPESPFKIKLLRNNGQPSNHHKALPDEEVDRVKRALPSLQDERQRMYMGFLAYTGLRREEILGLGWEHVNLKERCISG